MQRMPSFKLVRAGDLRAPDPWAVGARREPGRELGLGRWMNLSGLPNVSTMVADEVVVSSHLIQSRLRTRLKSQIGNPQDGRISLAGLSDQVFSR